MNKEFIEKARSAKSADELLKLAEENGMKLSEEEANVYFEKINNSAELSDEELSKVVGGIYSPFLYGGEIKISPLFDREPGGSGRTNMRVL